MKVDTLQIRWVWKAIPGCPGRYTLVTSDRYLPLQSILEDGTCRVNEYDSIQAKGRVLVVPLVDGGIISYRRKDGTFVHTLNTYEGFLRKLAQLGIERGNPLLKSIDRGHEK